MSRCPVAGPSEYWFLASSPSSKVKKQQCTHSTTNTHKITTTIHTANQQQLHTRQLKTSNNTHDTNATLPDFSDTHVRARTTACQSHTVPSLTVNEELYFCTSSSGYCVSGWELPVVWRLDMTMSDSTRTFWRKVNSLPLRNRIRYQLTNQPTN